MKDGNFKWSLDRQSMYMHCPRAYYHSCIIKNDMLSRQLASISNLEQWSISIIRNTIRTALQAWAKGGTVPTDGILKENALGIMRKTWLSCLEGEWKNDPENSTNIFELYYGSGRDYATLRKLPQETTDAAKNKIMDAMDAFAHSRFIAELAGTNKAEWYFPAQTEGFSIDGIQACESPDFIFRDTDGKICTAAWIFGNEYRPHLRIRQACHKMYAMENCSAEEDNIRIITVFLNDGGRDRDCIVTHGDLTTVRTQISKGAEAMQSRINGSVQIEDYQQQPSENCQFCNFKRICMEQ